MPHFLDRLTELAGAETTATLQSEFGGTSCYLPRSDRPHAQPVVVVLQGHFSPLQPIAQVAMNLGIGLQALAAAGVEVESIGINPIGLGDGYIDALQGPLGLRGVSVKATQ
jgi:hypothetical protein